MNRGSDDDDDDDDDDLNLTPFFSFFFKLVQVDGNFSRG